MMENQHIADIIKDIIKKAEKLYWPNSSHKDPYAKVEVNIEYDPMFSIFATRLSFWNSKNSRQTTRSDCQKLLDMNSVSSSLIDAIEDMSVQINKLEYPETIQHNGRIYRLDQSL